MRRVARVDGVPRAFTALLHWINVKECRRVGHVLPEGWDFTIPIVCTHCGLILTDRGSTLSR